MDLFQRALFPPLINTTVSAAERLLPTALVNATLLPMLLFSLAGQKYFPKTATNIYEEYDYVIVGAGTAGSILASRLSEVECVNVLLLEAGGEPPLISEVPALARLLLFSHIDWKYKTVPQKYTGDQLKNRQVLWPSGKTIGGSSVLNAMLYTRGNRKDYDAWAAGGATGWSYKEVFKYFLKMEDNRDPEYVANGYHGVGGPQTIHRPRYHSEIKDPLFQAAMSLGYQVVDPNGPRQTGFYDYQGFLRSGQRCSTAKGYLVPAENRTNLDILPNARVRKVVIENKEAVGVEFDYEGQTYVVKARKEVIVSAGSINTPQILMLSGIGPRKELERHRIPMVADLPVGQNLQDHCSAFNSYELSPTIPNVILKTINPLNIAEYLANRTGPFSSLEYCSGVAFLRNGTANPEIDSPEFQLYFLEATAELALQAGYNAKTLAQVFAPYEGKSFYICVSHLLKSRSRGTVTLSSADPYDPPLIDPNYFDDPKDLDDVVAGLKVCNRIANTSQMRSVGSRPFRTLYPGCEQLAGNEDAYLRCLVKAGVITQSHPVGTAKMGDPMDPTTVVDSELRVKNIKRLRVVDASVMPTIPSGSTNAPTIMVAEKASDIIRSTIECDIFNPGPSGDWTWKLGLPPSDAVPNGKGNDDDGYWVEVTPPPFVYGENKTREPVLLKVTPWNKEIKDASPWSQLINTLASGIASLVDILSLRNIIPNVLREQLETLLNIPQTDVASILSSLTGGISSLFQQTVQRLLPGISLPFQGGSSNQNQDQSSNIIPDTPLSNILPDSVLSLLGQGQSGNQLQQQLPNALQGAGNQLPQQLPNALQGAGNQLQQQLPNALQGAGNQLQQQLPNALQGNGNQLQQQLPNALQGIIPQSGSQPSPASLLSSVNSGNGRQSVLGLLSNSAAEAVSQRVPLGNAAAN